MFVIFESAGREEACDSFCFSGIVRVVVSTIQRVTLSACHLMYGVCDDFFYNLERTQIAIETINDF